MKTPFRHLLLSAAVAFFFTLTFAVFAQEAPPGTPPPAPPAQPPQAAPSAPPAAEIPPAVPVAPAVAVEAEKATDGEAPLRRLDVPAKNGGTKSDKSAPAKRRREARSGANGGDFPMGDHTITAGSRVPEAVSIMGATIVEGEVVADAVSVLGRTTIAPGGKVGGAAVAVLGPLVSQGSIGDSAVSVLGGVEINGPVKGEVVSVLGNLKLGPDAVIGGDVVLVGGSLTRDPKAIIRGNLVNTPVLGAIGDIAWLTTWVKRCVFLARPLAFGAHLGWAWAVALSFLAFYLLLALLFRDGVEKCVTTFETRPGMAVLSSVLTVLLTPVVMVILVATVVGLVVVPFAGIGLMLATLFGKTVMLAWLGRRITKFFGDRPLGHPVFAVLIGGAIVLLLYTIPVFGFLFYKLLSWLGLGVVVFTIVLALRREKPPVPSSPLPAPTFPPTAGAPGIGNVPSAAAFAVPLTVSPGFSGAASAVPPAVPATPETPVVPELPGSSAVMGFAAGGPMASGIVAPAAPAATSVPPPAPAAPAAASAPFYPVVTAPAFSASTLPRAGFMIRLCALALDAILVGMVVGFTSGMLPRVLQFNHGPGGVLLFLAAYGAIMWKHKGTTIGGIVCGLKVVRVDHREIDWATAWVRALGCFLSLMVAGLGFIWVAFDEDKQSWHDKIAGTTVVRVPKGVSLL